ncbi:RNA polymerase sigma factor [Denitratisoma sp. agr-D3]
METTYPLDAAMADQDHHLTAAIRRERGRLGNFIRQRVPDPDEAEDILQEVFFEFVSAWRLPDPIEQVGAWLFRVARNRIVDRFRKHREVPLPEADDDASLDLLLPDPAAGPEAAYARAVLLDALSSALDGLPEEQRAVFIAHELEGRSFKVMAAESGTPINTLLGRKRLAVRQLRARLQPFYDELDS